MSDLGQEGCGFLEPCFEKFTKIEIHPHPSNWVIFNELASSSKKPKAAIPPKTLIWKWARQLIRKGFTISEGVRGIEKSNRFSFKYPRSILGIHDLLEVVKPRVGLYILLTREWSAFSYHVFKMDCIEQWVKFEFWKVECLVSAMLLRTIQRTIWDDEGPSVKFGELATIQSKLLIMFSPKPNLISWQGFF